MKADSQTIYHWGSIIGNRFRSGLRDVVSPLTQTGLCVLDVTDVSFEELGPDRGRPSLDVGRGKPAGSLDHGRPQPVVESR